MFRLMNHSRTYDAMHPTIEDVLRALPSDAVGNVQGSDDYLKPAAPEMLKAMKVGWWRHFRGGDDSWLVVRNR